MLSTKTFTDLKKHLSLPNVDSQVYEGEQGVPTVSGDGSKLEKIKPLLMTVCKENTFDIIKTLFVL